MKQSRSLDQILYRLLLARLFLPLLLLTVLGFASAIYLGKRNLEVQQQQLASSMAQMVDDYLDQAGRVLDAVAHVAEMSEVEDEHVGLYMQATWEAYGYFEALYRLDKEGIVVLLAPTELRYQRYLGLDMSRQSYFERARAQKTIVISAPFNSLSTGRPTVYMAYALEDGGLVVGALSLQALQTTIVEASDDLSAYGEVFIVDRSGTLLAHTLYSERVAQQENIGHLQVVRRGLDDKVTLIYRAEGQLMLGSGVPITRVGWVVVEQLPFLIAYGPYVGMMSFLFLLAVSIWGALAWTLRDWLGHHVVAPLSQLGRVTEAIASGDFAQEEALSTIPTAFVELNVLRRDFQWMSQVIQARQMALQRSEERYRTLYGVSHLLVGIPTLDEVSQAALLAVPHIGAQRGDLILLNVQGQPKLYSTHLVHSTPQHIQALIQPIRVTGLGRQAYPTGMLSQPLLIEDVWRDSPTDVDASGHLVRSLRALLDPESHGDIHSVMVLPLLGQYEETIGFMIYSHRQPGVFGEDDVDLAEESP